MNKKEKTKCLMFELNSNVTRESSFVFAFVHRTSFQIPDSCQNPWTCGTQAPGWLQGGHPSLEDGVAMRNVCFSWNGNCCFTKVQAQVRLCYGFFVYKLQPTTFAVKAKYCVGR